MAFDVSNTPDGYTIEVSGSFTFTSKCGVRTTPDMSATPVAYYDIGQTVYYSRKVKNGNHFWLSYIGQSGNWAYVPYANTDKGTLFGNDSNPVNPIVPKDDGSYDEREQGGQNTGTPSLSGAKPLSSLDGYEYPATGWVQMKSGAQERKTPDFDNGEKGTKHYSGDTKIKYTAKVNGSGRMWVKVAATGWYLPIGKLSTLDSLHKLPAPGRYEEAGYVTDQNSSQPWEDVWPYSSTVGGTNSKGNKLGSNTETWETEYAIVNDTPSTSFTPTSAELSKMEKIKSDIEANASKDDVIITYITDTHVDSYQSPADAAALRGIELASYYSKTFGSDLMVHGGDLEDGNTSRKLSLIDMKRSVDAVKLSQRPYIILQGNHDDNSGYVRDMAGYQTDQLIGNDTAANERTSNVLIRPTGSQNPNNAVYGTYDIPDSKVTIMVLDGFDQPDVDTVHTRENDGKVHFDSFRHGYTKYSQAQHDWAVSTMRSLVAQGRQVLVMNHIALKGVKNWQDTKATRFEVTDLSNLGQKMYDDVIKPNSKNIIGYVSGHTHEDDHALSDGVQFITTTCAQAGRGRNAAKRSSPNDFAFDILQISPKNRTVYRHRFGFGASQVDSTMRTSGALLKEWNW